MDVKSIKFRKDRVDEYTVNHWFDAGTDHLPAVYAHKHYYYNVYDAEGNCYTRGNSYMTTLKQVKEWLCDYDAEKEVELAEERAEKAAEQKKWDDRLALEAKFQEEFSKPVTDKKVPQVNDLLTLSEPKLNKNCTIGEYVSQLYTDDFYDTKSKVVKVINITDAQWLEFVDNLMDSHSFIEYDKSEEGNQKGGSECNDPIFDGKTWSDVASDPVLLDYYRENCVSLVHAIVSPNQRTFYVNTEGYNYARYVLLESSFLIA